MLKLGFSPAWFLVVNDLFTDCRTLMVLYLAGVIFRVHCFCFFSFLMNCAALYFFPSMSEGYAFSGAILLNYYVHFIKSCYFEKWETLFSWCNHNLF